MSAPLPTALRDALRSGTAQAHQHLESALDLLAPPLQPRRFAAVLQRFHGFHRVWEPALRAALPGESAFLRPRSRLPQLRQDLALFGLDAAQVDALPACADAASLCDSPASAWGSLYVMEGSTLGGKFIARAVREAPGYPAGAWSYFDPYGERTGSCWQETLARLAALPPALEPAVVAGARRCFELLQGWLVLDEVAV